MLSLFVFPSPLLFTLNDAVLEHTQQVAPQPHNPPPRATPRPDRRRRRIDAQ